MSKIVKALSKEQSKQIVDLLKRDNPQAKTSGKYLQKLRCPRCGKEEAFSFIDTPWAVICPRENECGVRTKTSEMYPEAFQNFGERYGNKAAEAYLKSRGLDTSEIDFRQIKDYRNGKKIIVVTFRLANGKFHTGRLIDASANDKKGWNKPGSKASKTLYMPDKIKNKKEVFVCEGIINALSLIQAGYQAVAVLSSNYTYSKNPELRKLIKKGHKFVIAMDNDKAGKKAAQKLIAIFKKHKIKYRIAFPPAKQDWNDLLIIDRLDKKNMEEYLRRGELFRLELENDIDGYFELLEKRYSGIKLFEYQGKYFFSKSDKKDGDFTKLSDFTCRILFSIVEEIDENTQRIRYMLETYSEREGYHQIEINGDAINSNSSFKSRISERVSQFWLGQQNHLNILIEKMLKAKPSEVRALDFHGYDSKSDCYVFSNVLYDRLGNRHELGEDKFFPKQKIMPMRGYPLQEHKIVTKASSSGKSQEDIFMLRFLRAVFKSYGHKGVIILGYYISSLFSHILQDEFGRFPFLMITGKPHTGKTTLLDIMNKCFAVDKTEIPASATNTKKGVVRELSRKRSLVTTITESRESKEPIDKGTLLNLYHWNDFDIRARFSNDNETLRTSFRGALCFAQNNHIYTEGAARQRFINIEFSVEEINDETKKSLDKLESMAGPSVIDQVLKKRKYFEDGIVGKVSHIQNKLKTEANIDVERIAYNHAVAYAGLKIFREVFKGKGVSPQKTYDYLAETARSKLENIYAESDLAEDFFSAFEELANGGHLIFGDHYIIAKDKMTGEDKVFIRLAFVLPIMNEKKFHFGSKLHDALKLHEASFVDSNHPKRSKYWRHKNKVQKCWIFKLEETGMKIDADKPRRLNLVS